VSPWDIAQGATVVFFLSYAEEDSETAAEIAMWLRRHDIEIFDWRAQRGGRFMPQIEAAIQKSEGFFALLSPSFLGSDWCSREKEMALQREQALQIGNPQLIFIHVLEILQTPNSNAGLLGGYDWVSFASAAGRTKSFAELASRIKPGIGPEPVTASNEPRAVASITSSSPLLPVFRNRDEELEKVLRGLAITGGPSFWLVIAPPQLGKTWFLERISAELTQSKSPSWVANYVDVRDLSISTRRDAGSLLARLFERTAPIADERGTLRSIAQDISRSGKSCLCLLDHAELLDKATAAAVRSYLSQIFRYVQNADRVGVRFGLIVASRREDEWMGVTPDPRMIPLPLTEFNVDVVQQALYELAQEMDRAGFAESRRTAALVYRLTEGLPALLVHCLQWIQLQEWLEMERLESQELFDELTDSYIREELLTQESLLPEDQEESGGSLVALEQAYRVLTPFRLFTKSHLRHYLEHDPAFRTALDSQQWSMEDLWEAISDTALLLRPLDEPWKQIHAAIRRLLHRHYYKSDDQRAEAHSEARKFVEVWMDQQSGKEQVIGLIECLWHEATALRTRQPADMNQRLCASAGMLSRQIRESPAYTPEELRRYAAGRMRNDTELQEAVSNVTGLFTRLVEIVLSPAQE
jgi:TIR domain